VREEINAPRQVINAQGYGSEEGSYKMREHVRDLALAMRLEMAVHEDSPQGSYGKLRRLKSFISYFNS
jgi:hypothetical protein